MTSEKEGIMIKNGSDVVHVIRQAGVYFTRKRRDISGIPKKKASAPEIRIPNHRSTNHLYFGCLRQNASSLISFTFAVVL